VVLGEFICARQTSIESRLLERDSAAKAEPINISLRNSP